MMTEGVLSEGAGNDLLLFESRTGSPQTSENRAFKNIFLGNKREVRLPLVVPVKFLGVFHAQKLGHSTLISFPENEFDRSTLHRPYPDGKGRELRWVTIA
jgi:hypothetical protein